MWGGRFTSRHGHDQATVLRQRSRFRAIWMSEKNESLVGARFSNDFTIVPGGGVRTEAWHVKGILLFAPWWNAIGRLWPERGQPTK